MKPKLLYVTPLILTYFITSTALADFRSYIIPSSKYEQDLNLKKIEIIYDKSIEKYFNLLAPLNYNFTPTTIKEIQLNLIGIERQKDLDSLYQEYIGKKITSAMLQELSSKLVDYCARKDLFLPKIEIIQHPKSKDILIINIKIGNINNIIITGDGENDDLIMAYASKILESKPTKTSHLKKYLALIKKAPGYKIEYTLEPSIGNSLSEVDLFLSTKKTNAEINANINNFGSNDLGKIQPSLTAQKFSFIDSKDSLFLRGSTTTHPNRLYDLGLGYNRIINTEGSSIYLFTSHSSKNTNKRKVVKTKNDKSNNFRLSLNHHLFITESYDLEGEIGVNYKNSLSYKVDNNIAQRDKKTNYWSSDIALKYHYIDNFGGKNFINLTYVQAINGKFINYKNSSDVADKNFNLVKFNFYKDQPLPNDFSLFAHLNASYSKYSLPDEELFKLGGRDFGRGYGFDTINGNRMLAFSIEARHTTKFKDHFIIDHLEPYIFYDTGYVGKQSSNTNITRLTSWGVGFKFKFHYDIELGTEIAIPTRKNYIVKDEAKISRTKIGIFINKKVSF